MSSPATTLFFTPSRVLPWRSWYCISSSNERIFRLEKCPPPLSWTTRSTNRRSRSPCRRRLSQSAELSRQMSRSGEGSSRMMEMKEVRRRASVSRPPSTLSSPLKTRIMYLHRGIDKQLIGWQVIYWQTADLLTNSWLTDKQLTDNWLTDKQLI